MSGEITCCVALLLALTLVFGARKKLYFINDVQLPIDTLELLRWFVNQITIYADDTILLNFDCGKYGSHHYGNFQKILEQPPPGYRYYTIGNIKDYPWTNNPGRNKARIIFSVRTGCRNVDRVYITRHYDTYGEESSNYDPTKTYEVTANFLRQISLENTSGARLQGNYNYDQNSPQQVGTEQKWILLVIALVFAFLILAFGQNVNK